jgi:hypothetical protein
MNGKSCRPAVVCNPFPGRVFFLTAGLLGKNCRATRQKFLTKLLKKLMFFDFLAPGSQSCHVLGGSAALPVCA